MDIRNIAIIAHVDHGKTTLTDALLRQCGMTEEGASMDSNQIERERGITIYAKNTSLRYRDTKVNIVDTPGHADFGSEVERVLRSVDSVLLVVDAQEGPMPQTRFVLKKSLELGHKPIIVVNKIDKPAADPDRVQDEVFNLMVELGASDEQLDFTTIYAIGRAGVAGRTPTEEMKDLSPLLDVIIDEVPCASNRTNEPFQAQIFNLAYDNFLGRLAIARVYAGVLPQNSTIIVRREGDDKVRTTKVTKLSSFEGMKRVDGESISAGDIVMIAGITDAYIGDTITTDMATGLLPAITIDEPTISLQFLVNDSPFAGREGTYVTSRQIRDRLERELEVNVGLRVNYENDQMMVFGRGELHVAVLLETMRREGYEVQVSQPQVIIKFDENNKKLEPWEEAIIDIPSEATGAVIDRLNRRRGMLADMREEGSHTRIVYNIPTRGLLGYRGQFVIDTKGEGTISSRFIDFKPYAGTVEKRETGSMISRETGGATAYAIWGLQERGLMYIEPGMEVYEGMVVGNTSKGDEMLVSPTKGKQLTNVRASGSDEAISLKPAYVLSIERGLEAMGDDEYLEITPTSVRLRKQYLKESERGRAGKGK